MIPKQRKTIPSTCDGVAAVFGMEYLPIDDILKGD